MLQIKIKCEQCNFKEFVEVSTTDDLKKLDEAYARKSIHVASTRHTVLATQNVIYTFGKLKRNEE